MRLLNASNLVSESALILAIAIPAAAFAQGNAPTVKPPQIVITPAVHHDTSPVLTAIPPKPVPPGQHIVPVKQPNLPQPANGNMQDGAIQSAVTAAAKPVVKYGFAGVGQGDYGFSDNAAPSDDNGALGDTQYVQTVNVSFAVFSKTSTAIEYGPVAINTLWTGFGGACEADNDGDPVVTFDKAAHRWLISQFAVSSGAPYMQCVAVSTTSDATGSYNRYAFSYGSNFNDYPKVGVWPDAYYFTFNLFANGQNFAGAEACAYDRTAMLAGNPATQICFIDQNEASLLPSDLNGTIAPPIGSPNYLLTLSPPSALSLFKFHVDWTTPSNSTFTGPTNIPVPTYTEAPFSDSVPQPGTSQMLDSLGDRLMYPLAYRAFADGHEALVTNHTVVAGNRFAPRWYEIRSPGGTPVVYQAGTYAPATDRTYRFMGSAAMNKNGSIVLGYSASSPSVYPSIFLAGRVPTDNISHLEKEITIKAGSGSQLPTLSRWGDYTGASVDPSNDCRFGYTNQYLKSSGDFNWSTWIALLSMGSCP